SDLLSPDSIALPAALILVVISKVKSDDLVCKLNMELFLYLIGIFVVSGAMEYTGIIELIGNGLSFLGQGDPFAVLIIMLWFSAYLSANIDNIPITKVLIPVVAHMTTGFSPVDTRFAYYSLVFGASLGDNLTPMGDNILVMNIAKTHKRPITVREFFILGFIATNIQLFFVTLYLSFAFKPELGLLLGLIAGLGFIVVIFVIKGLKKTGRWPVTRHREETDSFKLDQGKKER
nr:SLC13 family permease [Candidatus Sigynarchaeota archaeon]